MKNLPNGQKNDLLWWIITILLFCSGAFWWAGLAVLLLNVNGRLPSVPALLQMLREGRADRRIHAAPLQEDAAAQAKASAPAAPSPVKFPAPRRPVGRGVWQTVTGVALMLGAVLGGGALAALVLDSADFIIRTAGLSGLAFLFTAGAVLTGLGARTRGKRRRFRTFLTMLRPGLRRVRIGALAEAQGRPESAVERDLEEMIARGYLGSAWIDHGAGLLRLEPMAEEPEPEPQPESGEPDETDAILQKIRADNDLIGDPEISRKIDEIQELTRKLLEFQEQNPDRAGELHTFTNYYLPQTFKLLETYARLEAQGADGENARAAKAQISGMLDKLIAGYSRQLDRLLAADVLDITADMRVMEQMLERDGLSGDDFVLK